MASGDEVETLKARAVYFTEPLKVEVREEAALRKAGTVMVRSELMGISHGTELLFLKGNVPKHMMVDEGIEALSGDISYPIKYGYVNVGKVENGDRVFCFYPHQDVFSVLEAECIRLPDGLDTEDAVFLANMETAVGIIQDLRPIMGETVFIAGQGVVGLLVAELLKAHHAGTIITADLFPFRRNASQQVGCISLDPTEEPVRKVMELTGGRGCDAAVNVTASSTALQMLVDSVALEGRIVEASWYGTKNTTINLGEAFHRKRITITSSQVSRIGGNLTPRWTKERRMNLALGFLELVRPSKYITHTYPLDEAEKAYSLIMEKPEETIQVVLKP